MKSKITLCNLPGGGSCPSVSLSNTQVTIGEFENTVKLKPGEWNKLVDLIKKGELKKV